jgi:hypothetical protein
MEAEITICILDKLEISSSPCYHAILNATDEETANRWTQTILIPLGKVEDG